MRSPKSGMAVAPVHMKQRGRYFRRRRCGHTSPQLPPARREDHHAVEGWSEPAAGRVAVVSGGNRGLGLDPVRRRAELGMRVVLGSRSVERGRLALDLLRELADQVAVRQLDITSAASVDALADWLQQRLGGGDRAGPGPTRASQSPPILPPPGFRRPKPRSPSSRRSLHTRDFAGDATPATSARPLLAGSRLPTRATTPRQPPRRNRADGLREGRVVAEQRFRSGRAGDGVRLFHRYDIPVVG